jgi:hypothetical protein
MCHQPKLALRFKDFTYTSLQSKQSINSVASQTQVEQQALQLQQQHI